MDVTPNIYGADGSSANARRGLLCCVLVSTSSRAQATRGETIQCREEEGGGEVCSSSAIQQEKYIQKENAE